VSETNRIKALVPFPDMFGAVRKLTGTLDPKSNDDVRFELIDAQPGRVFPP
jgi:hypothetical protein